MKMETAVSKVLERRKWTRVGAILASLCLMVFLVQLLLEHPWKSKAAAYAFDATQLTVGQNDILYIGKDGLQSERVWEENSPRWDTTSSRSALRASTHRMSMPLGYIIPDDKIYQTALDMTYPAGTVNGSARCPTTKWGQAEAPSSTTSYSGACKAILTNGTGAIIDVGGGTITIDGVVVLGDRVVLRAGNIILGPNARIMAQGQDAEVWDGGDNPGIGGLGAHSGGQAPWSNRDDQPGAPWLHSLPGFDAPNLWNPNTQSYYYPISTGSLNLDPYFSGIKGGDGAHGTEALNRGGTTQYGDLIEGDEGMGGSGGSGGNNEEQSGKDSGAGGGGGGGYGIAFITNSYASDPQSLINARGGNGGKSSPDTGRDPTGGPGGGGGGGVVIIQASSVTNSGNISVEGGSGVIDSRRDDKPMSSSGQDGRIVVNSGSSSVSIKKTLQPIERGGLACQSFVPPYTGENCFNPYSLQEGDVLGVQLDLSGLQAGNNTVADELLHTNSPPLTCAPIDGTIDPDTDLISDTAVEWNISSTVSSLYYTCRVQ